METNNKPPNEIRTLDDLIEKKYKIITVIGVFGALTLLSTELEPPPYLITFGTLAIFLILCWEFYKHIPRIEDPKTFYSPLRLFEWIFLFGFLLPIYGYVAYFSFKLHPELKIIFIIFFIWVPIFNVLYLILNHLEKNPKIAQHPNERSIRILLFLLFIVLGFIATYAITKVFEGDFGNIF